MMISSLRLLNCFVSIPCSKRCRFWWDIVRKVRDGPLIRASLNFGIGKSDKSSSMGMVNGSELTDECVCLLAHLLKIFTQAFKVLLLRGCESEANVNAPVFRAIIT